MNIDEIPEHVRKIAAVIANDPVKVNNFNKVAMSLDALTVQKLFGAAQPSGGQAILRGIATTAGAALAIGAGKTLHDKFVQITNAKHPRTYEEEVSELGKLNARSTFSTLRAQELMPAQTHVLKTLMQSDDIIKDAPKDLVNSSFTTMRRFAPNLAADENAARSFLRTAIASGAGPSFATLQTLADAEKSVAQAGGINFMSGK